MKWSWRKALGIADRPLTLNIPAPAEQKPAGLNISAATVWEARTHGKPVITPDAIYAPYQPVPGTFPPTAAGIAQDALPATYNATNAVGVWATEAAFHEGLTFLGYPYLAELSQRAEYRHAAEIIGEHATRKWIKLRGDDENVAKINDEFKRLGLREAFRELATKEGIFGRCQLFLDFDDADDTVEIDTPLMVDPTKINPSRPLRRVTVVEPVWSYPAPYRTINPLAVDFYTPTRWLVQGRYVDASRLLTFVSREVPDILKPAYAFGGQSLTSLMKPYVDNWLRTRQSVSDLLHSFSVMVLATDLETMLTPGNATSVGMRVNYFTNYRDNNGLMVINKQTEELTNVSAQIAGLEGLQAQAQEQLASVARIPLSIYIQSTPDGLNASSEGEIRSFYADIKAYQEKLFRSPIQRILEITQLSLFGAIDAGITFEFEDLFEMSEKDKADIAKLEAETDHIYVTDGVVSNDEARDRLKADEVGPYYGLKLQGEAPEPEPEPEPNGAEGDNADDKPD